MVDANVREHERRWRETGAPDDQARWLVARLRAGELARERVELAACLGSGAARAALDGRVREWDPPRDDPRVWLMALSAWGDEVLVRGLALGLGAFDPAPWRHAVAPALDDVLAWCDAPSPERARDVAARHTPTLDAIAADAPWLPVLADLTRALDAPRRRLELLAMSLAGVDVANTSHWLAFEARRLLLEWALGVPDDLRATLPPVPDGPHLVHALRERFSRPPPRRGLLAWLDAGPPPIEVASCLPLHAAGWLRRHRVLDVTAAGVDLLHVSLPGARFHSGLLLLDARGGAPERGASGPRGAEADPRGGGSSLPARPASGSRRTHHTDVTVWPLDRRQPEHLDRLLDGEGALPADVDPLDLATLVALALVPGRNDCARVVGAAEDLAREGYVVDAAAARGYRAALAPPALEHEAGGWTLRFVCLSGWMHETQRLARVVVDKRPGAPTRLVDETLCERVYAETPRIVY